MDKNSRQFLEELLLTPSPTGFERDIQRVVKKHMSPFADSIELDLHGNLIVALNPTAPRRIMLAGHCDQIGFMVKHISNEGFIYIMPLGGVDVGVLHGARVSIHTENKVIEGVMGRKPIHAQSADERDRTKNDINNIWIDIGAKNKKEAEKLVNIGDPITFKLEFTDLMNGFISGPALDDKSGLFVVMETIKLLRKSKLNVGVYAVSTVQEEVGLRGAKTAAYSVDPEVGIAVDVTLSTDNPGQDNSKSVPCVLGKGPGISKGPNTNPVLGELLVKTAKKFKIPYQLEPSGRPLGNDANAIQLNKSGVAAASIALPCRYLHTQVEVVSLSDLTNSAKLLAEFIKSIVPKTDFRPH
jgi:putative aminopeptidase FrvX